MFNEELSNAEKAGITVRRLCGLVKGRDSNGVLESCDQEAVGEFVLQLDDGQEVPIAVCQWHRDQIVGPPRDYSIVPPKIEMPDTFSSVRLDTNKE